MDPPLRRFEPSPDPRHHAVLVGPARPLLAADHPASAAWGNHRLDPGLGGAWHPHLHADALHLVTAGRSRRWTPATGPLLRAVAWHPTRPRVAGLAVTGHRARLFVADAALGELTTPADLPLGISFTWYAARPHPLCWLDDHRLIVLRRTGSSPATTATPQRYEARGPGILQFTPRIEELADLAAATVVVLDLGTGAVTELTGPLLVTDLALSPARTHLIVRHLTDYDLDGPRRASLIVDVARGPGPEVDGPAAWGTGDSDIAWWPAGGTDAVIWTAGRGRVEVPVAGLGFTPITALVHDARPVLLGNRAGALEAVEPDGTTHRLADRAGFLPAAARPLHLQGTARFILAGKADHRPGLALIDLAEHTACTAWAPRADPRSQLWPVHHDGDLGLLVAGRTTVTRYRLTGGTLRPTGPPLRGFRHHTKRTDGHRGTRHPVHTGHGDAELTLPPDPSRARLLWIVPYLSTEPRPPAADQPGAVLRLPIHWPPDATATTLRSQLTTAIGAAVHMLPAGPVVVAGHSFGATLALHALAHVPGIAAAIAMSGCYNRTLTPCGFQYEHRTYWQAPTVYTELSPALFADRLAGPVLIIHGAQDTHPATTPDQAVALYTAIVATGGHARLVLLPGESHSYVYAESLHTVADEQHSWLDRFADTTPGPSIPASTPL